jgi:hypothetical protein
MSRKSSALIFESIRSIGNYEVSDEEEEEGVIDKKEKKNEIPVGRNRLLSPLLWDILVSISSVIYSLCFPFIIAFPPTSKIWTIIFYISLGLMEIICWIDLVIIMFKPVMIRGEIITNRWLALKLKTKRVKYYLIVLETIPFWVFNLVSGWTWEWTLIWRLSLIWKVFKMS